MTVRRSTIRGRSSQAVTARLFLSLMTGLTGGLGCRSESDAGAGATTRSTGNSTAHTPATRPTTTRAAERPPDPGGCLGTACHDPLLAVSYRHEPAFLGACDACHEPEQPDHKFPLKRPGVEGCTFCHPVVGHHEHGHEVIAKEGCLPCHDPHGSNTKFLLTAASTELTCRPCHEIERKSHLHGPFAGGQCTTCHQPHESDNKFLLLGGEGKEHCLMCHRSMRHQLTAATRVHEPMEEGCTGCHDPHSSDEEDMLTVAMDKLCFTCHPEVEGTVAEAMSPHGAVFTGQRCANCHDPHAEGRPYLLRDELATLCLGCHDKPQKAYDGRTIPDMRPVLSDRKSLHGPVRSGECNACHQVHGSRHAKLLRKYFPPEFYEAFDLAHYALCFECHDKDIILEKETRKLTGFRDGANNLHYVHVNRPEKGRTCRACHEIHGSDLPRHMASTVNFEGGAWAMPIGFKKTLDGGRCAPGCHDEKGYRRGQPLNPSTAPSEEKGQ